MINRRISVIVCAYNQGKWIIDCIKSIKNQKNITKKEFEIILVNDCSTDETHSVIKKIKQYKNFHYIKNNKNLGLPKSINKAIKKSKGKYIVRVDADDYVEKNFLSISRSFLEFNPKYQAVAVDYYKVNEKNIIIEKVNSSKKEIACGVMFLKKNLFLIGLYNEKFKMREGHELKKRFTKKFKLGRVKTPLYNYRQHENNRTKNKNKLKIYDKLIKKINK